MVKAIEDIKALKDENRALRGYATSSVECTENRHTDVADSRAKNATDDTMGRWLKISNI